MKKTSPKANISITRIVLGMALVTIGVLAVLSHYAVISIDISSVFCLFPLAVVLIGLSMLSIRSWLWVSVILLAILALFSAAIAISIGFLKVPGVQYSAQTKEIVIASQNSDIKMLDISVKNVVGDIHIASSDSDSLLTAKYSASGMIRQTSALKDGTQSISLDQTKRRGWWHALPQDRLALTLNESIVTDLSLSTGAATLNADLSNVYLQKLSLKSGASSNIIRLGDKTDHTVVDLDIGMSSIEVFVPEGTGIRTSFESGISNTKTPELLDISEKVRETSNYKTAARKVDFEGKIGMADLKISYY